MAEVVDCSTAREDCVIKYARSFRSLCDQLNPIEKPVDDTDKPPNRLLLPSEVPLLILLAPLIGRSSAPHLSPPTIHLSPQVSPATGNSPKSSSLQAVPAWAYAHMSLMATPKVATCPIGFMASRPLPGRMLHGRTTLTWPHGHLASSWPHDHMSWRMVVC
ncbi:hypothetical protein Dimus_000708 [Dionaea muscipula]